jgi:hypothetical protein
MADKIPKGAYVCVHAIRYHDGKMSTRIVYSGTHAECTVIAQDEPIDVGVSEDAIAKEIWIVQPSAEYLALIEDAKIMDARTRPS